MKLLLNTRIFSTALLLCLIASITLVLGQRETLQEGEITWAQSCGGMASIKNYYVEGCHSQTQCTFLPWTDSKARFDFKPNLHLFWLESVVTASSASRSKVITLRKYNTTGLISALDYHTVRFPINLENNFGYNETIDIKFSLTSAYGLQACESFRAMAYGTKEGGSGAAQIATLSLAVLTAIPVFRSILF